MPYLSYLSHFSQPFMLAIALWPVLSFALTVPVLAMLYHRDNRLTLPAALAAYGTVLYFIGLLCLTLYPMPDDPAAYCATHHLSPQLDPLRFIADIRTDGANAVMQILMNIVFFLPLGYITRRVFRWRMRAALPFAFAASLAVETLQLTGVLGIYPCAYRFFDVDDLLANTLGAALGFGAATLVDRLFPPRAADTATTANPRFVRRCVAFAIDMALTALAAVPAAMLVSVAYTAIAYGSLDVWHTWELVGGWTIGDLTMLASLAVFEWAIPWRRGGRTLGGSYTRMTCETRARAGWRRTVFYAARFAVLAMIVFGGHLPLTGTLVLALAVFWIVARKMPYDLI